MTRALSRLSSVGLLVAAGLSLAACSVIQLGHGGPEPSGSEQPDTPREARQEARTARQATFVARQYLERGRRAWVTGNKANARFLIGRAIELDPAYPPAVAFWEARWPRDSLPPAAQAAIARAAAGEADPADLAPAIPGVAAGAESPPADTGAGESDVVTGPRPGEPADADTGATGDRATASDTAAIASLLPEHPLGEGPVAESATPPPGPRVSPEELDALRGRFESARSAADRAAMQKAGEELLAAYPNHLGDLYRVLATWVDRNVALAAAETRVRDVLGSLEFGDPAFLAEKPDDVPAKDYFRLYRGRLLDLLGWTAFQRGEMVQAEAALQSAQNEINLRGRGDVTNLRHLALFYERRGNLAKAESYAIAAAARDDSGSGELRALAARIWSRRKGRSAGLDGRLASEASRVRREERSAAIAGRLYTGLPVFVATRDGGAPLTEKSFRGKVTILVLWEEGCTDCARLLRDLAARWGTRGAAGAQPGGSGQPTASARGSAPRAELLAFDVGKDAASANSGGSSPVPAGVVAARPERPIPFARTFGARHLPMTLVVEAAGFVQYRHSGYPSETRELERWHERLRWQVESLQTLKTGGTTARRAVRPRAPQRARGRAPAG